MANALTASGITSSQVTLDYQIDNTTRDFGVYAFIFLAEGNLTQAQIEASYATYLIQTRGLSPFEQLNDSVTRTGLSANTTYSFMYSVQRDNTFDPAEVIFRRPLSPPGTFTTFGPPIYTDTSLASGTQGVYYSDGVSATNAVSYSISSGSLPPGLSISSNYGTISGTPSANGTYSFTVSANNAYGSTLANLSITINPPTPVWTDQVLASPAYVDSPYSDGVSATYATSYVISSGSLPTGLSLNSSTGAVTGTPTTEQTASFTIQASNLTGTISQGFTIQVLTGLEPPAFTDETLSNDLRVFIAYADAVSATNEPTYSISAGTLVPGLSLNSSTGAVTGTPTAQGAYSFTIQATNAAGNDTAPFTLNVKPGAKRYDGGAFQPIERLQRWDGAAWVDVTFTKRWDGSTWQDMNG